MQGLAEEVGNGCTYTISLGGQEVTTGTCNIGAMVYDLNTSMVPTGGMSLFMQGLVDMGNDTAGLSRRFDLTLDSKGSWRDQSGKVIEGDAEYMQGPTALNTSNTILQATSDSHFLRADCKVSGTIHSVRSVCVFGMNQQYEIHGTLDGRCDGTAGAEVSSDPSPEVTIHVKL